jgi:hypothetical protein
VGVVLSPYYAALLTCLLAEELARMKEKDRLPKEYVEEQRKRHEEEASRLEAQLAKEQRARRKKQAARVEVDGRRKNERSREHCDWERRCLFIFMWSLKHS